MWRGFSQCLWFLASLLVASMHCLAGVQLTFDAAASGTIQDKNGLGTGFTHRLPGTGGGLPTNDPNLHLDTSSGKLFITSTKSDINQSNSGTVRNLGTLEAPGLLLSGIGNLDVSVTAIFRNVFVPNTSDQLAIYAGVSSEQVLRVSAHSGNTFVFSENFGSGDQNTFTPQNSFGSGDDLQFTLSRTAGVWQFAWLNLTTNAQGTLGNKALPWLDTANDLYVGVLASNAGTDTSFVGELDYFSVAGAQPVPEPASLAMWGAGAFGAFMVRRRRQNRSQAV